MDGRCWVFGSFGFCLSWGRWNRLGFASGSKSFALRIGPLGVLVANGWMPASNATASEITNAIQENRT